MNDFLIINLFKLNIIIFKTQLNKRFYIKNINACNYYLNFKIIRDYFNKIF